jgi:hypothetical protein
MSRSSAPSGILESFRRLYEKPLEPPDSIHLQAAQGWLELGDHIEASEELEKITPQLRAHPDVLKARWEVYY